MIPGLAHWVKDPVLPKASAQVTDAAWIQCCCGCGVRPAAAALIRPLAWAVKRKKKSCPSVSYHEGGCWLPLLPCITNPGCYLHLCLNLYQFLSLSLHLYLISLSLVGKPRRLSEHFAWSGCQPDTLASSSHFIRTTFLGGGSSIALSDAEVQRGQATL